MSPIAAALSASERDSVAAYYGKRAGVAAIRPAVLFAAAGRELVTRGRWSEEIPACTECHGGDVLGAGPNFPPLAGQSAAYIRNQLIAWQLKTRDAGPLGLMGAIAQKLSAQDIDAVAAFIGAPTTLGTTR